MVISNLKKHLNIVAFGDVIESISGGATPLRAREEQYTDSGIKFLRIQNITSIGFDFSDVKYITEKVHNNLLKRSQLVENDLLMTITGRIGTSAVVTNSCLPANINQHIVRIRLKEGTNPNFAAAYLNSNIGLLLSNRSVTGTTRLALDYESIKKIPFPVLLPEEQLSLSSEDSVSIREYTEKLLQADGLISMCKDKVFASLNLHFREYSPALFSASKLGDIRELGIYCNPHSNYLNNVFAKLRTNEFFVGHLEDFVEINPKTSRESLQDKTAVSFVPMTAVTEKTNEVVYELKTYNEVKTGFTIFQKGDLLWAKITPCMQNGKSFVASNMPTDIGFGSTEFHVLRVRNTQQIYMPYLWVILSNEHILEAAQGMFGGSAGQQRVPDTFLKKFPIILPHYETQVELAEQVFEALNKAKTMRTKAKQDWQVAREQFEKELLGE